MLAGFCPSARIRQYMNNQSSPPEPRLRQLFLSALELKDPAARRNFLKGIEAGLRAEIESLLEQHKEDSFLEASDPNAETSQGASKPVPEPGARLQYFGNYELLGEIAR